MKRVMLTTLVVLSVLPCLCGLASAQSADDRTYYVYGNGGQLLAEYDALGQCTREYLYLGSKLVAETRPQEGTTFYYTTDQVSTARVLTDDSGNRVYAASYGPYGDRQKVWEQSTEPKPGFSGSERDDSTGLDYFGARYYDHQQARFVSVDPMMSKVAALTNPQQWNLYAYCRNNPLSYQDPFGTSEVPAGDPMDPNSYVYPELAQRLGPPHALRGEYGIWYLDGTDSYLMMRLGKWVPSAQPDPVGVTVRLVKEYLEYRKTATGQLKEGILLAFPKAYVAAYVFAAHLATDPVDATVTMADCLINGKEYDFVESAIVDVLLPNKFGKTGEIAAEAYEWGKALYEAFGEKNDPSEAFKKVLVTGTKKGAGLD